MRKPVDNPWSASDRAYVPHDEIAQDEVSQATYPHEAGDLLEWLMSGECQSDSGAFCAWRDVNRDALAFEYPEITGYALTLLASTRVLDARASRVGRMAADWLVSRFEAGNFAARDEWDGEAVYNFDLAMIATGLLRFGEVSRRQRWMTWGFALVNMLREQVDLDGSLPAVSQAPASFSNRPDVWSTEGHSHLLKAVQCLLLAARLGLHGAAETAASIVEFSKRFQHYDGRFETQPRDSVTMLHPHLYAAEGLWVYGTATGDEEALVRARAAVAWAWRHQLEGGGFPRAVTVQDGRFEGVQVEQLDVTSQAVRLAVLVGSRQPRLHDAVGRLRATSEPVAGGFALPYQPSAGDRHLNTWASMFATQALRLAGTGASEFSWMDLV